MQALQRVCKAIRSSQPLTDRYYKRYILSLRENLYSYRKKNAVIYARWLSELVSIELSDYDKRILAANLIALSKTELYAKR
jgi:hypothetical protein